MNLFLLNASTISAELLPLFIILVVMIVPISILLVIVLIKFIIKNVKRNKKVNKEEIINKYLLPFGEDNIISLDTNMRRVNVEVKDINKINIEELKKLGVGILITGNTVKCSSAEFAMAVEEKK